MKDTAMKCSQEQFDKIKPILEEHGFKMYDIWDFSRCSYLVNNYGDKNVYISNVHANHTNNCINRTVFHEWNEDIFLEYCGIALKKEPLFTIQDLADGKCAVINDGTYKELQTVLKAVYPLTHSWYGLNSSSYYYWTKDNYYWKNNELNKSNLPVQSVKEFLKMINEKEPEFVLGKTWHIKVTEENQNIVSEWRFTDTSKKLNIGYVTGMYNWNGEGRRIQKEHNSYKDDNNWGDEITTEQFKKYVLKQEYKYTPEYCKNNKVAIFVKTQSDIDGLKQLNCTGCMVSLNSYTNGFYTIPSKDTWGINRTYFNKNYEVINASDFIKNNLKTTNMEKKIIGYKLIKPEFEEAAVAICKGYGARDIFDFKLVEKDCSFREMSNTKDWLEKAGVLNIWFEPVYEEEKKIIKMHSSNKGEFEIEIFNGKAFYRPDNKELTKEFIEEILDWYDDSNTYNSFATHLMYSLKVEELTVGCMKGTRKEDWLKVLKEIE